VTTGVAIESSTRTVIQVQFTLPEMFMALSGVTLGQIQEGISQAKAVATARMIAYGEIKSLTYEWGCMMEHTTQESSIITHTAPLAGIQTP
jgi:hypothetical protein